MPTSNRTADRSPRRKATLFCQDCGHEGRLAGGWVVRERGERVDYECPQCGTTITSRRRPDGPSVSSEDRRCVTPSD